MQPYIIRIPSTAPAPLAWKYWVIGEWVKSHVVRRGSNEYLGCVWKDSKGWRFAVRGGRFNIKAGRYPSPKIYRYRHEAAKALWKEFPA